MAAKAEILKQLKAEIAQIEQKPILADSIPADLVDTGDLTIPRGILHEIYADTVCDAGISSGFALAVANTQLNSQRKTIIYAYLEKEAQSHGLLYGPGLLSVGIDPSSIIFVRAHKAEELLWAIEESSACRAVSCVIADFGRTPKSLDFTASRRLSMRATTSCCTVILLKYGSARPTTAATLRWKIEPERSAPLEFDPRAPGKPRWRAKLEKGRLTAMQTGESQILEWHGRNISIIRKPQKAAPSHRDEWLHRASG